MNSFPSLCRVCWPVVAVRKGWRGRGSPSQPGQVGVGRSCARAVALESNSATPPRWCRRHCGPTCACVCECVWGGSDPPLPLCCPVLLLFAAGKHERTRDGISGKRLPSPLLLLLAPRTEPLLDTGYYGIVWQPTSSPCGAGRGRTLTLEEAKHRFHEVGGDRFDRRQRLR